MVAIRNANGEAIWKRIIETAFAGEEPGPHNVMESAGVPNVTTNDRRILCYDSTNNDVYINTTGTTWLKINA